MALDATMAATNAETHATVGSLLRLLDDKLKLEMVDGRATGSWAFDENIPNRVQASAKRRPVFTRDYGNMDGVAEGMVRKEFVA